MKNFKINQIEKSMKTYLKRKISITKQTLIAFLITGAFGFVGENLFAGVVNDNNKNSIHVGTVANEGNNNILVGDVATPSIYSLIFADKTTGGWHGSGKYKLAFGEGVNSDGSANYGIIFGNSAGQAASGSYKFILGQGAGFRNSGDYNFAFGWKAGNDSRTMYNFAFGSEAGHNIRGAEGNNVAFMNGAGANIEGSYNMSIGFQTGQYTKGSYNFAFGSQAGKTVVGDENIAIGSHAGKNVTGRVNYALGIHAGQNVAGNGNYAIGENAGQNVKAATNPDSETKGWSNFAIGKGAGNNIIGNHNYSFGENAGKYVGYRVSWNEGVFADNSNPQEYVRPGEQDSSKKSGAEHNIALGPNSGNYIAGQDNVALGQGAGSYIDGANSGGAANTAIGKGAGNKVYGDENISMGSSAGNDINGHQNIALGVSSASKIKGNKNIAIGVSSSNTTGNFIEKTDTISLGTEADATKNNAIAIGKGAKATAESSISIGTGNVVSGNKSGAIGDPSYVSGEGTYTIGNDNGTENEKIDANNAGIFGNSNKMTADATGSRIVGNTNIVSKENVFVLGNNITANIANSVYLGKESEAVNNGDTTAGATTTYNSENIISVAETGRVVRNITLNNFAGHTPVGVITVGKVGSERRIQNVAAGKISATSTDAINGSQLYALASKLSDIETSVTANSIQYFSVNSKDGENKDNKGAIGENSIAIGKNAKSSKENSVSIGLNAKSLGGNSVTLGINAQTYYYAVAIGDTAKSGHYSIALGQKSEALPSQSISIGMEAKINETKTNKSAVSIAIGNETQINDSTQSLAIGARSKIENSENSIALGTKSTVINGGNSVAIGANSSAKSVEAIAIGIRSVIDKNASSSIALGRDSYVGEIKEKNENLPNTGQPDINIGDYVEEKVMNPLNKNKYYYSMALGADSRAYGYQNTALGAGAEAYNTNSLAVGMATTSKGDFSSAIGRQAYTNGKYATALGYLSKSVEESALALGDNAIADKKQGIALGSNSKTDTSKQFGYDPSGNFTNLDTLLKENKATYDSKNQEISALEREVSELSNQYIALLNEKNTANAERLKEIDTELAAKETELSAKKEELKTKKSELNKMISVWNATSEGLSIGNSELGLTRQINNVAAGTKDTDAVNVAQLKGVTLRVTGDNLANDTEAVGKVKLSEQNLAIKGTAGEITTSVTKDGQAVTISLAENIKNSITNINNKVDRSEIATIDLIVTNGKIADIEDNNKNKFVTAETIKNSINNSGFYVSSAAAGGTNTGDAKTLVKAGEEVILKAGKNITINQNGKEFTFSADIPSVNSKTVEYFSVNSTVDGNKDNSGATATNAIAIGPNSTATKKNALAIGDIANAGEYAVALGTETNATGKGAIALGNKIKAIGENSTAIGVEATAKGFQSISMGGLSKAEGKYSIAIGSSTYASKLNSISIGVNSKSLNNNSIVLGNGSIAFGAKNVTVGNSSVTNNLDSTAVGNETFTIGTFSTALGSHSSALSYSTISIGNEASAKAYKSVSIGDKASSEGINSISFGSDSASKSDNSVAIGNFAKSNKISGVALGANSVVNSDIGNLGYDHFLGEITTVSNIPGLTDEDKQKIAQLETTVLELKSNYESKVDTYLKRLNTLNLELKKAILNKDEDKIDELTEEKEILESDVNDAREEYLSNSSVIEYNKLVGAWKSSLGAVSIGDSEKGLTRQINNVAAGTKDTDAVNVAQLKGVTLRVTGDNYDANVEAAADVNKNKENIGKVKLSEQNLAIKGTAGEITTSVTKDGQAVTISLADDIKNSITNINNKVDRSEIATTNLTVENGKIADIVDNNNKNKFVTAETIKTAINDTGFYVNSAAAGGTNTGAAKTLVKAGEEVILKAGKNITINQNGKEFTFSADIPSVNSKTVEYFSVNSTVNGNKDNSGATATNAIAIGPSSTATAESALALGDTANAGKFAVALGALTNATGEGSVSLGNTVKSEGKYSIAIGVQSKAIGIQSVSIGTLANVVGNNSIGIGTKAKVSKNDSVSIGNSAQTNEHYSTSIGSSSITGGGYSTALGAFASAQSDSGVALGYRASAVGYRATSLGSSSRAAGYSSTAVGDNSKALSDNSVAIGNFAKSDVISGVALGANSVVSSEIGSLGYDHFLRKTIDNVNAISTLSDEDKTKVTQLETKVLELKSNYETKVAEYNERIKTLNIALTIARNQGNEAEVKALITERSALERSLDSLRKAYLTDDDVVEYNKLVGAWKSSLGAVSIGDSEKGLTRQINNVSAGTQDTDAVNVAQLKGVTLRVTGDNYAANVEATTNANKNKENIGKIKLSEQNLSIVGLNGITTKVDKDGQTVTISLADNIATTKDLATTELTVTNGKVNDINDTDKAKLVTADSIKNAINNSGLYVSIDGKDENKKLITLGNTLNFIAGNNVTITKENDGIKFDVNIPAVPEVNVEITGDNYITVNENSNNTFTLTTKKGEINVKNGGLVTEVKDGLVDTETLKNTVNALGNNTIKLVSNSGETTNQNLNKTDGLSFNIKGEGLVTTKAEGNTVTIDLSDEAKNKINSLENTTNTRTLEAISGVANAVAMANLLQASSFNEYRHQLSAAYGYYGRQHALALGFSGVTKGRKVVYRVSGAVNNSGYLAFGAGIGVMLGEKMDDNDTDRPTTLHKTIEELKKENKQNKEVIKSLLERIEKLEKRSK